MEMEVALGLDRDALRADLSVAYPPDVVDRLVTRIEDVVAHYREQITQPRPSWVDEGDAMLITYGDSIGDGARAPLAVLAAFLAAHVGDAISSVHILPFYPYTSDDGFSVVDYRAVDTGLGDWDDVARLADRYALMFDAVINHVSRHSVWFQKFLADDPAYADYFIACAPDADTSQVTRPRALPLLTPVDCASGTKHVWTTFSDDQIDLNYANPDVLVEIVDLLLFYAAQGARYIRLDAIGFMWKELGTTCMHLPQAHALIRAMRQAVDAASPGTLVITETNVPHADNVSYFGNGGDEAHMVYQFPLPPLTLHAFQTGDASRLSDWAASLPPTTPQTTFFNFLASHDGIGVRPVEGILSPAEVKAMAAGVEARGGLISVRNMPDGTTAPYELNIAYVDAIAEPDDDDETRAARFLAAQTVLLSMAGVPGIYIHSLLGSRNDLAGVARTGRNRSINRAKLGLGDLEAELARPDSLRARILAGTLKLLGLRRQRPAFHPNAGQRIVPVDPRVFSLVRENPQDRVWVAVNVSADTVSLRVRCATIGFAAGAALADVIGGAEVGGAEVGGDAEHIALTLAPFQSAWVAAG